jgi:hypothetical protein
MFTEEYFKTPFWFEEKLDFLKSLTKQPTHILRKLKNLEKKILK